MAKTLSSNSNPIVKHLLKLRTDAHYRKDQGTVLIEGKKLISDLADDFSFERIIAKEAHLIPQKAEAKEIFLADEQILKKLSSTETPEGIAAEIKLPKEINFKGNHCLALDAISDPGNLGTLFRTALAFGWDGIFLLPGCCDPFNDKALRAAKGATFKIPFQRGDAASLKKIAEQNQLLPLAADLKGKKPEKIFHEKVLLVLGSEGQGLSEEIKNFCTLTSLPMSNQMESLNVASAGAIFLYLLQKKVH